LELIKTCITKKICSSSKPNHSKLFCVQEIRRHLRQKRPQDTASYDASLEDEDNNDGAEEILAGEEVNGEGGARNYSVANISKEQSGQERGIETVTESKNDEKEGRSAGNQTKHTYVHQHNRNNSKGDQHRGTKKPKLPAATTISTVTKQGSIRQEKTDEKKFDETLFEEYDSESSRGGSLVTTEHSRFHHRHHHYSPNSELTSFHSTNVTTDPSAHLDSVVEVTLDYLDFNITEGPSTEYSVLLNSTSSNPTSQQRVKPSKPTASNENKVSFFFLHKVHKMLSYNKKAVSVCMVDLKNHLLEL
jgi:hypothetical protein